jgi:hypothetical protein
VRWPQAADHGGSAGRTLVSLRARCRRASGRNPERLPCRLELGKRVGEQVIAKGKPIARTPCGPAAFRWDRATGKARIP